MTYIKLIQYYSRIQQITLLQDIALKHTFYHEVKVRGHHALFKHN